MRRLVDDFYTEASPHMLSVGLLSMTLDAKGERFFYSKGILPMFDLLLIGELLAVSEPSTG